MVLELLKAAWGGGWLAPATSKELQKEMRKGTMEPCQEGTR